jgi:hypothetical protein
VLFTIYHSDDQVKKTEMGRICSTYGEKNMHTGFQWGSLREGDHLKERGVEGRVLKCICEKLDWGHGLDRSGSD